MGAVKSKLPLIIIIAHKSCIVNRQIRVCDSKLWHFRRRIFIPFPLAPQPPKYALHILLFHLKHTVPVITHAHVLQNFYTTWVRSVACQKQRLEPKLEGAWLGEHPKIWDPLRRPISAIVEVSNFKFGTQLGFGTSLQKNNV